MFHAACGLKTLPASGVICVLSARVLHHPIINVSLSLKNILELCRGNLLEIRHKTVV